MSEFVISTRYANALMAISEEKGSFDKTLSDVLLIKNTLKGSKELVNFLSNPIIVTEKKSIVLREVFQSHIGVDTKNFLSFLVEKGRENILPDICDRFIALSNKKLNQVDVDISSAIEMNDSQQNDIKEKLEAIINKKIIATFNVDNEIIGGFKARFNDTIIDASVQRQLELLKKRLFEEDYLKN